MAQRLEVIHVSAHLKNRSRCTAALLFRPG